MKPRTEVRFDRAMRRTFLHAANERSGDGADNVFLLNHARSGIALALMSLKLPPHSRVGVMAYNCHTVTEAIANAGLLPLFIDVDDSLRIDLDDLQRKSADLKALVVTHLFGITGNIETIRLRHPHLTIIEDCAHAYGTGGHTGDFIVYSTGQGKLPAVGDGGILVVENRRHLEAVARLYSQIPYYSAIGEAKLFLRLLATSLIVNSNILFLIRHTKTRAFFKDKNDKKNNGVIIHFARMSRGVQAVYEMEKDNVAGQIVQRRAQAEREAARLKSNPLVKEVLYGENAFMLVVRCTDPVALKAQYEREGIEAATHFANCIRWARNDGYNGDCPNAEKLVKELLMIPTY